MGAYYYNNSNLFKVAFSKDADPASETFYQYCLEYVSSDGANAHQVNHLYKKLISLYGIDTGSREANLEAAAVIEKLKPIVLQHSEKDGRRFSRYCSSVEKIKKDLDKKQKLLEHEVFKAKVRFYQELGDPELIRIEDMKRIRSGLNTAVKNTKEKFGLSKDPFLELNKKYESIRQKSSKSYMLKVRKVIAEALWRIRASSK